MLTYLLERFVRRLCGRWLHNLSPDSFSVSLGGTVELKELWLDTSEISLMLLPIEPVIGYCGCLRIELPLSLSGELVLLAQDVVLVARCQDYRVDIETARRAVEIAINLYWTNYLRSPQLLDTAPKAQELNSTANVADTIASLAKCLRVEIKSLRLAVNCSLPHRFLGAPSCERVELIVSIDEICIGTATEQQRDTNVSKKIVARNLQVGYSAGTSLFAQGHPREKDVHRLLNETPQRDSCVSVGTIDVHCALDLLNVAAAIRELPPASVLSERWHSSADGEAALLPWLSKCDFQINVDEVKVELTSTLLSLCVDICDRVTHCHRRRQDAARSARGSASAFQLLPAAWHSSSTQTRAVPRCDRATEDAEPGAEEILVEDPRSSLSHSEEGTNEGEIEGPGYSSPSHERSRALWAMAIGAVLCDLETKRRLTDVTRWRAWFEEWRRAARYVAIRKLLHAQLRCTIFRHGSSGELYYELAETCSAARAGKVYLHPAQLPAEDCRRANEIVQNAMRATASAENSVAKAMSSWRQLKRQANGLSSDRIEPRLAIALYAEQLWLDSIFPAHRAAALRALARRQTKSAKRAKSDHFARVYSLHAPSILLAPVDVTNVESSAYLSDIRVDFQAGNTTVRSAKASPSPSPSTSLSWLERDGPISAQGDDEWFVELPGDELSIGVSIVDAGVSGAYESTLGSTTYRRQAPAQATCSLIDVFIGKASAFYPFASSSPMHLRFGMSTCQSGRAIHKARKALAQLVCRERRKVFRVSLPRSTELSISLRLNRLRVALLSHHEATFMAKSLVGHTQVVVPGSRVDAPAGTGEGSMLAALSRAANILLTPGQCGPIWRAEEASLRIDGQARNVEVACARPISSHLGRLMFAVAPDGRTIVSTAQTTDWCVDMIPTTSRRSFFPLSVSYATSRAFQLNEIGFVLLVNERPVVGAAKELPLYILACTDSQTDDLDACDFVLVETESDSTLRQLSTGPVQEPVGPTRVPTRVVDESIYDQPLRGNAHRRAVEDAAPYLGIEDMEHYQLLQRIEPCQPVENTALYDELAENMVPCPALENMSLYQLVENMVPSPAVEDKVPCQAVETTAPHHAVEDSVASQAIEESVPCQTVEDSVPCQPVEVSVPCEDVEDSVPSEVVEDSVPSEDVEDSAPSEVVEDSVPSEVVEDSVPSEVVEDSVSSEVVEDSVPSKVVEDSVPSEVVEDSVPSEVVEDSVPSKVVEDSVPSEVVEDSVPSKVVEDTVPCQGFEDREHREDTVPCHTVEDSVPSQGFEDSVQSQTVEKSVPFTTDGGAMHDHAVKDSGPHLAIEGRISPASRDSPSASSTPPVVSKTPRYEAARVNSRQHDTTPSPSQRYDVQQAADATCRCAIQ